MNQKNNDDKEEDNGVFIMDDPLLNKSDINEKII